MLDKKDTTLLKLDCKNKDKVYDMLFGKADACLKNAKTVALLYLGSPYYMTRALEEYNIEEVNIFTTKDFKFIYEPFENAERAKIWYVDNVKDTFKECDMKFDCIIMNPPYGDRYNPYLHNMIYSNACTQLSKGGKCVCLMPAGKLETPRLLNKKDLNNTRLYTTEINFVTAAEANNIFSTALAESLGIYISQNGVKSTINWKYIAFKQNKNFENIATKIYSCMEPLNKFCYKTPENFSYCLSLNHGHPGCNDEFDLASSNEKYVFSTKGGSQCVFFNFTTSAMRNNFKKCIDSIPMKFLRFLERNSLHIYLQMFPWLGNSINPRTGLKGYESEWTDQDFYKFFNITPAEQKIIEETMEKYK